MSAVGPRGTLEQRQALLRSWATKEGVALDTLKDPAVQAKASEALGLGDVRAVVEGLFATGFSDAPGRTVSPQLSPPDGPVPARYPTASVVFDTSERAAVRPDSIPGYVGHSPVDAGDLDTFLRYAQKSGTKLTPTDHGTARRLAEGSFQSALSLVTDHGFEAVQTSNQGRAALRAADGDFTTAVMLTEHAGAERKPLLEAFAATLRERLEGGTDGSGRPSLEKALALVQRQLQ